MLWLLLALSIVPQQPVIRDRVDVIEVNHFYDEAGRHVFDQAIFWDWSPRRRRYEARAFRLLKHPSQEPVRVAFGQYVSIWEDGGGLRRVCAPSRRETWTQYDPELRNRAYLPKDMRRGLTRIVPRIGKQGHEVFWHPIADVEVVR